MLFFLSLTTTLYSMQTEEAILDEFGEFEEFGHDENFDEEDEYDIQGSSMKCDLCMNLIRDAEEYLINHEEDGLDEYLKDNYCPKTPVMRETCFALVNTIIKKAINDIRHQLAPWEICRNLKACL
ncbi:uncharacterized protein MONOS_15562 [Monocercomonoides exilis]|uniref:uncharacterized protein n=1 Tax=Monocercomonoides exilis TaxID=2049356 RepID=UPI003559B3C7|nr:hypothetical protein MONOS_15562 [Monocercomonoides exilis]|eukprot:MONOS_15562.1-p1 / transcript=MONOS_15562.1 / gene=MONOS_15562 / organism=Monocercomonoides_exilis_PA203 / gene_product=unspecified product / transcript_product=unspecified product / location=Mono_scaffold01272:8967-9449(+) / protein_length=125 / sequence_SO=supercontig / SO=protein_coding / is_pseudo=false